MVVALVQKCGRDAREQGHEPPTNLGFFLDEFFDFYGNQLNYASTGEYQGVPVGLLTSAAPRVKSLSSRPSDDHTGGVK